MKKIGSVFLAALLVACSFLPAFAADGSHNVTFGTPSSNFETDAYAFYRSVDGFFADFAEDPNGAYGHYSKDGKYYLIDDLTDSSRKVFEEAAPGTEEAKRFTPVPYQNGSVADGTTVTFIVVTSEKYDINSVVVLCNGEIVQKNTKNEYAVTADRDLAFSVQEFDENNAPILLKSHFIVTLTSGDGYAAKPIQGANNKVAYYGEDYEFRVKISKGFNGSNMQVKVLRGSNFLAEYIGEEADMLSTVMGDAETLSSTGVDSDGYRTYKITNITTDCKVLISGVNKDSTSGVLAMLKRILRLLLGLLGINLDDLLGEDLNPLAAHTITLNADVDTTFATYTTDPAFNYNASSGNYEAEILSGECVSVVISTTKQELTNPNLHPVTWTKASEPDKLYGMDYNISWQAYYDIDSSKTYWTAIWYVDGLTSDATINIAI